MSNPIGDFVSGIVQRALQFVIKDLVPEVAADVAGPFGLLLKAALATDYVQGLESQVASKIEAVTSSELAAIEADCQKWASEFLKGHPAVQEFWNAVKPPPKVEFDLKDDELAKVLELQKAGALRPALGLS